MPEAQAAKKPGSGWINIAVDYGPIVAFFLAYRWFKPAGGDGAGEIFAVTHGTIAFMVTAIVALAVSKWKLGKISPMLWLSTVLILGFGGLTVFLGDPFWVQIKPTVIYLFFAAMLFVGLWRGKPLLRYLLEAAFEGLSERGWLLLSRNWAWFFLALAGLNEALRHWLDFETWLVAKLWVFVPLSFLFTLVQIPMLMRHGLAAEEKADVLSDPPHE